MAAISTNTIPAAAPAPAKANGHAVKAHDTKASGEDPFAALLNAAHAQPAASPAGNDKNGADSDKEDAPATAEAATDTAASTKEAQPGKTDAGKPEAKDNKTANDNDPADALAQAAAQPNDPNAAAQTQIASAQTAVQPLQAANDDAGEHDEAGAIDAAQSSAKAGIKSAAKPALAAPAAADAPAANSQSPAAAAHAAATGTNNNGGNKDGNAGKDAEHAAKAEIKTASADSAPKADAPQPSQSAQPAPPVTAAATASHTLPVQTASVSHETAAQVQVTPHTATPDVNTLAVEIAARSQSGARQFSIRLDPPELGRVDVRLSIDATGKAEAHLTADHPDTLSLLQKDSSTLTQALRASGLDVSHDGLNFSLRDQNSHAGHDHGNQGRRTNLTATRAIDAAQTASSITFTGDGNGRVDIHV